MAKSGTKLGLVFNRPSLVFKSTSSVSNRLSSVFRCTPQQRYLEAKSDTHLGPVDLCSDVSPVEVSSGQEW